MNSNEPWQLLMFKKTLKKKMRLQHLKNHIGAVGSNQQCILITCGDNNGAMNFHLRALGGSWFFADLEPKSITEMETLLGDKVSHVRHDSLPYEDNFFDLVVVIDVHEHLAEPSLFTRELHRIAKQGATIVITCPNGDETKLATRIKNMVGMTKEKYGHFREGYTLPELKDLMQQCGISPRGDSTFSKFFTEMLELSINFLYVIVLAKKSKAKVETGTIAPSTAEQLKSVQKTYKIYSLVYPIFLLLSKLDLLLPFSLGYVVMVRGENAA